MTTNEQDSKVVIALTRSYEILKMTPQEIKNALSDLTGIQQLAVSTELIRSLTEAEVAALNNDLAAKSVEGKQAMIEEIAKAHAADNDFKARAQAAIKKTLDDHIAYIKTRGDDTQKAEVAKILAEIG